MIDSVKIDAEKAEKNLYDRFRKILEENETVKQ